MKKTLLFLMALLTMGVGGAWAAVTQPTLTTDTDKPVYYTIQNKRSSNYATFNGEGLAVTHEPGIGWGSIWYFVENGEGVSLVPAAAPSMRINASKVADASGVKWYLKESFNSGYFCISQSATDVTGGTSSTKDCWDASTSSTSIGNWYNKSGDAEGTSWTISAISTEDVAALQSAYNGMTPNLPTGKYLSIGDQVTSITSASSGDDNDHWYIISQDRGGTATPMYNTGYNTNLKRAATSVTPSTLEGQNVSLNKIYLVRFIDAGNGLYNIQFADGSYIVNPTTGEPADGNNPKLTYYGPQAKFAFTLIDVSTRFSWNLHNATGKSMDNNGANSTVSYWGSGTVTDASSTKSWMIQPVTFTDAIPYPFNTTYGAFFQGLTTNKAAGDGNYCNLWLSKNAAGKPQLKLITNDASASAGNNMRSSGGLFTTASTSGYTYNLSVSEGKIKSYTIVGTAVGALSITPAGGSAEEYAASASVSKKVTLDTPARQTSFTLTTLGGGAQWLDVTKFIIEYESDATVVESLSDITNAGIYTLEPHNAERGVMYAGTVYMDACGGHANTNYPANKATAIDATDPNQQFVLYTYGGNTYLYNVGRAKFAGVADGLYYKLTGAPVNTWTVSAGAYDKYFHLTSGADSKMATINAWTNTGSSDSKDYAITGQSANEEANNFLLHQVGTLTTEQQTAIETIITNYLTLQASLTKLGEYTVGTELNQYSNASLPDNEAKETAIADMQEGLKDCASSDIPTANTQVQALITAMTLNMPATNTFFRIKGYATNKYAKAGIFTAANVNANDDPTSLIPNTVNTEANGSDIWYYDSSNHLINYYNGLGTVVTRAFAALSKTKETTTFEASTCSANGAKKIGVYEIKSNYNGSQVWYSNTNNVDRNSANNHVNCEWVLEAVESLPVTIGSALYASLWSPVALSIPEDVTAYVATDKGAYLLLEPIEDGVIPAETGVVLKATAAGTYNFAITDAAGSVTSVLTGRTATINKPTEAYYLSNGDSGIGFYKDGSATTLAGFKAYLGAGTVPVKAFRFADVDAINNLFENGENAEIYDLSGRRISQPKRGLYIVNGKKVLVK